MTLDRFCKSTTYFSVFSANNFGFWKDCSMHYIPKTTKVVKLG